jgi:hypothetical protein
LFACFPAGLVGLPLSTIDVLRARNRPAAKHERFLGLTGLTLNFVGLFVSLPLALMAFGHMREISLRSLCQSNLRALAKGLRIYADENGGAYPPDLITLVGTGGATTGQLRCLFDWNPRGLPTYTYMTRLRSDDPADVVVLYEPSSNHIGQAICYRDGRVEYVDDQRLMDELRRCEQARRRNARE